MMMMMMTRTRKRQECDKNRKSMTSNNKATHNGNNSLVSLVVNKKKIPNKRTRHNTSKSKPYHDNNLKLQGITQSNHIYICLILFLLSVLFCDLLFCLVSSATHTGAGATTDGEVSGPQRLSSGGFDETLLVLANERISLLEKQLENMESEAEAARAYRRELDESKEWIQKSLDENKTLETELQKANGDMLKIRTMLTRLSGRGVDLSRVIAAVDHSLGREGGDVNVKARKAKSYPMRKVDKERT